MVDGTEDGNDRESQVAADHTHSLLPSSSHGKPPRKEILKHAKHAETILKQQVWPVSVGLEILHC